MTPGFSAWAVGRGRNRFPVGIVLVGMGLADQEWRLIREEAWEGPVNMALDEVAAETAAAGGVRTLRVYRWEPSTLSLGYRQAAATVDWEYCAAAGVGVTRRPTGGGGIYHDSVGDVSYTIVAPAAELPGDLMACYHVLLEPVFEAFERMGVPAVSANEEQPAVYEPACYLREIHPAHDIVVGGRKISGNAQYRQKDAVIQHGSITYEREVERHLGVFRDPGVDRAGFEDRVTSIREASGISRAAAVGCLEDALAEWVDADPGAWSEAEVARAREVAAEKYESEAWNHRV